MPSLLEPLGKLPCRKGGPGQGAPRWRDRRSRASAAGGRSEEGRHSPSPVWGLEAMPPGMGAMPPGKFSKNQREIAYFGAFLQAEMVSSALSTRQD